MALRQRVIETGRSHGAAPPHFVRKLFQLASVLAVISPGIMRNNVFQGSVVPLAGNQLRMSEPAHRRISETDVAGQLARKAAPSNALPPTLTTAHQLFIALESDSIANFSKDGHIPYVTSPLLRCTVRATKKMAAVGARGVLVSQHCAKRFH